MNNQNIHSNIEWKSWGKLDPLFAVASWKNKEKDGLSPWTDNEFYRLGQSDWNDFLIHWKKYGLSYESCLEIGCGAGRLTKHLAKYFKIVHAVDVSEDMIAYARQQIKDTKIIFHLTNGINIPLKDRSVSSAFSTHVFQHFDSLDHASAYFKEISRILKPNGSLMIHIPVYKWPTNQPIFDLIYRFRKYLTDFKAKIQRFFIKRGLSRPMMRGLEYPINYLYDILPKYHFTDIEICYFKTKSNNGLHPFVFARKINK